jgi:hypothetical protein
MVLSKERVSGFDLVGCREHARTKRSNFWKTLSLFYSSRVVPLSPLASTPALSLAQFDGCTRLDYTRKRPSFSRPT